MDDKVANAVDWLRTAKDKLRSFAGVEETPAPAPRRVGLALAGGFARGIAHIGALRALKNAGIPIDVVAGTSVGALIGACYCARVPLDEMQRIATTTTFHDFGRWTPSWLGLATNQRMEKYLARFTPATTFEELTTPLSGAKRTHQLKFRVQAGVQLLAIPATPPRGVVVSQGTRPRGPAAIWADSTRAGLRRPKCSRRDTPRRGALGGTG